MVAIVAGLAVVVAIQYLVGRVFGASKSIIEALTYFVFPRLGSGASLKRDGQPVPLRV
jgi:hypothetical protein